MRYGPDDKFWMVTDPTPESEMGDICFETTLRSLALQLKGGLTIEQNPTIFTDHDAAVAEASRRHFAVRALRAAMCEGGRAGDAWNHVRKVRFLAEDGSIIHEAEGVRGRRGAPAVPPAPDSGPTASTWGTTGGCSAGRSGAPGRRPTTRGGISRGRWSP